MTKTKFAGTCIIQDGKILLVQEGHKEAYGLWSLPVGHVEEGEKESETAIRETEEETGYRVKVAKVKKELIQGKVFKSLQSFDGSFIELSIFEAEVESGTLQAGNDVLNVKWFSLSDVEKLPLRGTWMKDFISTNTLYLHYEI